MDLNAPCCEKTLDASVAACGCGNFGVAGNLSLKPSDHFRAWKAEDQGSSSSKVSTGLFLVTPGPPAPQLVFQGTHAANAAAAAAGLASVLGVSAGGTWWRSCNSFLPLLEPWDACGLEVFGRSVLLDLNYLARRSHKKEGLYVEIFLLLTTRVKVWQQHREYCFTVHDSKHNFRHPDLAQYTCWVHLHLNILVSTKIPKSLPSLGTSTGVFWAPLFQLPLLVTCTPCLLPFSWSSSAWQLPCLVPLVLFEMFAACFDIVSLPSILCSSSLAW